ncbi:hypothetical protein GLYMA_10G082602v4 [Glycine max]|uniref:Uncharacterized protein n=1 Tax=Glycine soja TaxID=3848 RepID=A0A0B2SV65_GLYSO|nr:hypothetical protein GLYMA_10G082602v4 [Glycine max]KAH1137327.1 hypothetical protein GYH30_027357 [Glycine max]KHN48429.1 hypothetical protein glysoja_034476 [Glycine soja]
MPELSLLLDILLDVPSIKLGLLKKTRTKTSWKTILLTIRNKITLLIVTIAIEYCSCVRRPTTLEAYFVIVDYFASLTSFRIDLSLKIGTKTSWKMILYLH